MKQTGFTKVKVTKEQLNAYHNYYHNETTYSILSLREYLGVANDKAIHLSGVKLKQTNFDWVDFQKIRFRKSKLTASQLRWASLNGADFKGTDLSGVEFCYSNLSLANFKDTNLTSACLFNTNLIGANFSGAIFKDTRFDGVILIGATGIPKKIWKRAEEQGAVTSLEELYEMMHKGLLTCDKLWEYAKSLKSLAAVEVNQELKASYEKAAHAFTAYVYKQPFIKQPRDASRTLALLQENVLRPRIEAGFLGKWHSFVQGFALPTDITKLVMTYICPNDYFSAASVSSFGDAGKSYIEKLEAERAGTGKPQAYMAMVEQEKQSGKKKHCIMF